VAEPTWESILQRAAAFAEWTDQRLVVDSVNPLSTNLAAVLAYIRN